MPSIELPYEIRVVEVTVPGPLTRVVEVIVPGPQGPPGEVSQAQLDSEAAARESADTSHAVAGDPHAGYRLESVPISAADVAGDIATQVELDAASALKVDKTTLTTDGDLLTRAGGIPIRTTRADLAADTAFTSTYEQLNSVAFYGAKGDYRQITDASITSGSSTLTSPTAAFTTVDVGKRVVVRSAGVAGANLSTTIVSYISPTQVTLAAAAGTTVLAERIVTDGAYTAGSATLTSATAAFTVGDVSKTINGTGYMILAYVSATEVTLNKAAAATLSGATVVIGGGFLAVTTNDSAAIQAALDVASAAGGGVVTAKGIFGLLTGIIGPSNVVFDASDATFIALGDIVPFTWTGKQQFYFRNARIRTAVSTTGPAIRLTGGCNNWEVASLRLLRNESQATYRFAIGIDHENSITGRWVKPYIDSRTVDNAGIGMWMHGLTSPVAAVSLVDPNIASGATLLLVENSTDFNLAGGAIQSGDCTYNLRAVSCERIHVQSTFMEGSAGLSNVNIQLESCSNCTIDTPTLDGKVKLINSGGTTLIGTRGLDLDINIGSADTLIVGGNEAGPGTFTANELGVRTRFVAASWDGIGSRSFVTRTGGVEISSNADVRSYNSGSSTWTKPHTTGTVEMIAIGGGGGGGAGRKGAAGSVRSGGGGGGGGGFSRVVYQAADLPATLNVTVGGGGGGAAAQATDSTDGANGSIGAHSFVGPALATCYICGPRGSGGVGGGAGTGGTGGGGAVGLFTGGTGGAASGSGGAGNPGTSTVSVGTGGGGAGGGVTSGDVAAAGGAGQVPSSQAGRTGPAGGAVDNPGANGTVPNTGTSSPSGGSGASGGGASITGAGGAGGGGVVGGGGGGGGAATNTVGSSGAGGAGGIGMVVIISQP